MARTDSIAPPAASTKRLKAKGKAAEVDSGDEGDEDEQPRKKARGPRKGKQSTQKKGQGKLEVLKTLPVEMITEVRPPPSPPPHLLTSSSPRSRC